MCGPVEGIKFDHEVPRTVPHTWQPNKNARAWLQERIAHPDHIHPSDLTDGALDLANGFKQRDRVISAKFLEGLLIGAARDSQIHRGIRIAHAIVVLDETDHSSNFDLSGTDIPYEVVLKGFYFASPVRLDNARFRRGFDVSDTVFAGPVIANNAEVDGFFIATRASFLDSSKDSATFSRLAVSGPLWMRWAIFAGGVEFSDARIGGTFSLREAYFKTPKKGIDAASFNRMVVDGTFVLRGAHLCTFFDASEGGVIIGGGLEAKKSLSYPPTDTELRRSSSPLDFENATIGGLADFDGAIIRALSLSGARIRGRLLFDGTKFLGPNETVDLTDAQVLSVTSVQGTELRGCLVLTRATFQSLLLNPKWPNWNGTPTPCQDDQQKIHPPKTLELEGMRYENISAGITPNDLAHGSTSDDLAQLLRGFEKSQYAPSVYADLEAFFKREAYPDRADAVFFAGQSRNQEKLWEGDLWDKLRAAALWWFGLSAGYGRRTLLALLGYCGWVALASIILFQIPTGRAPRVKYVNFLLPWLWPGIYQEFAPRRWRIPLNHQAVAFILGIVGIILFITIVWAITGGDISGLARHFFGF
jgi:hypothetical protein